MPDIINLLRATEHGLEAVDIIYTTDRDGEWMYTPVSDRAKEFFEEMCFIKLSWNEGYLFAYDHNNFFERQGFTCERKQ